MKENLMPQQVEDYITSKELAQMANEAFDRRHAAAKELVNLTNRKTDHKLRTDFTQSDEDFKLLNAAAKTLMPPRAAFESARSDETLASKNVWQAMSPEQRTKATELRSLLAEGPLKQYGVSQDNLRVVLIEAEGNKHFRLIHTGNGVDIGNPKETYHKDRSYEYVMSKDNNKLFQIELNGTIYDARSGMTSEVYDAKVADARERGVTLPDSQPLSIETGDDWTWTMLTGEPLRADGDVQIRSVDDGGVGSDVSGPDDDRRDLRVCPAVEI